MICGSSSVADRSGSARSWACRPGRSRGSWRDAVSRGWRCWTRSPGRSSGRRRPPRSATSTTIPARWCIWTSRSSDASRWEGWRGRNETVANHRSRKDKTTRVGFDYVHSLVDDHSRLAYSEVLPDEQGPTCAAFLDRALDYFAAHGIPKVERLMTDNAWAYRWSLRTTCAARGNIKQVFIRPHCPWQNGKVERLNRTLLTEWAYRQAFTSNDQRTAALAPWLEHYNTERRHSALGGLPPVSRLPT